MLQACSVCEPQRRCLARQGQPPGCRGGARGGADARHTDRLEAAPTRAAKGDAPEEGVRITLIAQAAPPSAEGSAETGDTLPASVTKSAPRTPGGALTSLRAPCTAGICFDTPCLTSACACACQSLDTVLGCRQGESAGPWMGPQPEASAGGGARCPVLFPLSVFPGVQRC